MYVPVQEKTNVYAIKHISHVQENETQGGDCNSLLKIPPPLFISVRQKYKIINFVLGWLGFFRLLIKRGYGFQSIPHL